MRSTHVRVLAIVACGALALAACGDAGGESSSDTPEITAADENQLDFPEGSTMAELADAGKITIGVKFDQPGIGLMRAGADAPEGFDIEMGKVIAAGLGIDEDSIDWKETISDNREPFLMNGEVDIVLASYSITPERRAIVGQAGPYYVTGQQLMVRADDDSIAGPEDLEGKEVCSVTGSTSIETVEKEYGATPRGFDTYSECNDQLLNGQIDAVTTDGAILLGYAAEQPDELKVVGPEFSEERYGIGYQDPEDTEFCQFLQDTIKKAQEDGTWQAAFEATLGAAPGVETPQPPEMDPCA